MLGLGKLKSIYFQGLDTKVNNMTLGVHAQQWLSTPDGMGNVHTINQLFIGVLFFRFVFEFIQ